jgi:hypothetical protein
MHGVRRGLVRLAPPLILIAAAIMCAVQPSNAANPAGISKVSIVEWGAPWTKRVQVEIDQNGVVAFGIGVSSSTELQKHGSSKLAPDSSSRVLRAMEAFRRPEAPEKTDQTDARRLSVKFESSARDWSVTIRGPLTSQESAAIHLLNQNLPAEYRLGER